MFMYVNVVNFESVPDNHSWYFHNLPAIQPMFLGLLEHVNYLCLDQWYFHLLQCSLVALVPTTIQLHWQAVQFHLQHAVD